MTVLEQMGAKAKAAARVLAKAGTVQKNKVLKAMAEALIAGTAEILAANEKDVEIA